MKKISVILLTCSLIFSGCSKEEKETKDDTKSYITLSVVNESEGYSLDGELVVPSNTSACAVIITGSGPNDMDGTLGPNTFYKDLAYELAENGIASYRYNKRSYQYSEDSLLDIQFDVHDEYTEDTVSAVNLIKSSEDVECEKTFLIGHSLGGFLIPMLDDYLEVDGYVLLAGNVTSLQKLMLKQFEYIAVLDDVVTDKEQAMIDEVAELNTLLENIDSLADSDALGGAYVPYWRSIIDYDPLEEARDISVPVIVMNGGMDYQVDESEFNLWKTVENDNWEYKFYEDLTHIFGVGNKIASPSDYNINQEVDETFINDLVEWMNK